MEDRKREEEKSMEARKRRKQIKETEDERFKKKKRKRRNKRIERDKEKQVDSDPDLVTGVQGATTKRNPPNKIESRHKSMYLIKEGGEKEEEERIQDQEDRPRRKVEW